MGFTSITRTRKPRPFDYKPRYYNERKERLAAIEARARAELGLESEVSSTTRRARMELDYSLTRGRAKRMGRSQAVRTLVLFALLALSVLVYTRL